MGGFFMGRKHEKVKTLFIGLLAGLSNGFFGSGGGSLAVPLMTGLLGMKEKKAHATAVSVIMFLTGASLFVYFKHGYLCDIFPRIGFFAHHTII